MPLVIGTRLGPYEVVAPLGSGGIARDGSRFLAIIPQSRANEQPLTVVVNWQAGLTSR